MVNGDYDKAWRPARLSLPRRSVAAVHRRAEAVSGTATTGAGTPAEPPSGGKLGVRPTTLTRSRSGAADRNPGRLSPRSAIAGRGVPPGVRDRPAGTAAPKSAIARPGRPP